jgi:hypothetical protein
MYLGFRQIHDFLIEQIVTRSSRGGEVLQSLSELPSALGIGGLSFMAASSKAKHLGVRSVNL